MSNPPEKCPCGKERAAENTLLDCPLPQGARNDLFTNTGPDLRFYDTQTAQVITFLHRTGLGFSPDTHDRILKDDPEVGDLDVDPIGGLSLNLDL